MNTAALAVQTGPAITDWLQASASIATMVVAIAALIVAWNAPKWAAEWSEKIRTQNETATEKRRQEMSIFMALMARRATLLHPDAISALNLVDIVFSDHREVRDAYRSFVQAAGEADAQPVKIIERYHALIASIARAVGMGDRITADDVRSGYYPIGLGKLDDAAVADAEEKIARRNLASLVGNKQG